jgi:signal transduction histidine kinase
LNQEKNELLGIVAHDLKNPLQTIQGSAQLIEMALTQENYCNKEEILEFAQMINLSAERMFQLVTNLLDMNTIDSGKMQIVLQAINILPILIRIVTEYREKAKAKNLTIHFTPSESNYFAHVDAKIVHQILDNLLSNAVKYSPFHHNIYIRISQDIQTVRCEIQDEGQGLSQAEQGKLFNKFSRLSPQPTGGEHSTGLGLFIVKKLIEAIQGKVWCESELEHGATFIVEFAKVNQCG